MPNVGGLTSSVSIVLFASIRFLALGHVAETLSRQEYFFLRLNEDSIARVQNQHSVIQQFRLLGIVMAPVFAAYA